MKILFVFERKGTAFFLYSQIKLKKNAIFHYFSTISPRILTFRLKIVGFKK